MQHFALEGIETLPITIFEFIYLNNLTSFDNEKK